MSRLRPLPPRKVRKVLLKLGWQSARQTGSHEVFQHPNKSYILVLPNHKEIKKGTLKSIIDDLEITIDEFYDLI